MANNSKNIKYITLEFEVQANTDEDLFETELGKSMDSYNESELDKCMCWRKSEKLEYIKQLIKDYKNDGEMPDEDFIDKLMEIMESEDY